MQSNTNKLVGSTSTVLRLSLQLVFPALSISTFSIKLCIVLFIEMLSILSLYLGLTQPNLGHYSA